MYEAENRMTSLSFSYRGKTVFTLTIEQNNVFCFQLDKFGFPDNKI